MDYCCTTKKYCKATTSWHGLICKLMTKSCHNEAWVYKRKGGLGEIEGSGMTGNSEVRPLAQCHALKPSVRFAKHPDHFFCSHYPFTNPSP